MISVWVTWLIAAGILLLIELFTGTVAALCISVGCVVTAIFSAFDIALAWQIIIFAVSVVLAFVFIRPAIKKFGLHKDSRKYRTNMDALIGRTGKVTNRVTNNFDDKGRVQIDGDSWLAYTTEPDWPIEEGCQVVVESYDSCVIKVRRQE